MIYTGVTGTGNPGDVSADPVTGQMYLADGYGNWVEIGGVMLSEKLQEMRDDQAATRANWANGAALFSEQQWADIIGHAQRYEMTAGNHAHFMRRDGSMLRLIDGDEGVEIWVSGILRLTLK